MGFQKCPICNGEGRKVNIHSTAMYETCTTCNGRGIIDELTGLPPKYNATTTDSNSSDFRDAPMESQQEYFGKK